MREALRRLHSAGPTGRHPAATIDARVVVGDITSEISRSVNDIGADLLVVGAPQRSLVSRLLLGTTAASLLRTSRVPMLAVPEVGTAGTHQESTSLQSAA